MRLSTPDRIALILSLAAVLVSAWVGRQIFDNIPHIEDEFALVWQARVFASGHLTAPSPQPPKSFLVPFVVDYQGRRFGKYPFSWPLALSLGILLGGREWVNPLLAGIAVWLTYRLGKKALNETVGLVASGLTLTSPFFLMNSGSLLSHPLGLALSAAFAWSWLEAFGEKDQRCSRLWQPTLMSAVCLGALALTRPYSAVAVAAPFGFHGLYRMWRGDRQERMRLAVFIIFALAISALHFVWQYALTGDPWLNPYTLWWPYDQVGFGPGHGHTETGHTLLKASVNTLHSLKMGAYDLFGWGVYSWLFLPFGMWAIRRNSKAILLSLAFPSLALFYMAYWVGAWLFGPRYYYEGLYSLTLLSAAGIVWMAGWSLEPGCFPIRQDGTRIVRPLLATGGLALLVLFNLMVYTPVRLGQMENLFGIGRENLEFFQTSEAQTLAPALVIVHSERWMGYTVFTELEDPFLTSPFIFAWDLTPEMNAAAAASFPERAVYHYYPEDKFSIYTSPKP